MAKHNLLSNAAKCTVTNSTSGSISTDSSTNAVNGISINPNSISINPSYYFYDSYESSKALLKSSNIELHLLNGLKIMLKIDWEKVYDLKELHKRTFKLVKKFPFVKTSSFPYTLFRYRTHYSYIDSALDPKYKVDCPLTAFMALVGILYEKFEEAVVADAIKN